MQDFMTDRQVAQMLGVALRSVQLWRYQARGGPDYIKLHSGSIRYSKATVRAWIKEHTVKGDWVKRLHKRDALKAAA